MESEAPQSGTIGGLPAAKRELRRMIRGRIAELDAAARQAMSLDICRKLAALAREKTIGAWPSLPPGRGRWTCCPCWT